MTGIDRTENQREGSYLGKSCGSRHGVSESAAEH